MLATNSSAAAAAIIKKVKATPKPPNHQPKAAVAIRRIISVSTAAPAAPAAPAEPTPGDIMQQLQQLTGAIQMQNQLNSQQPQPETVEDILATVLEP